MWLVKYAIEYLDKRLLKNVNRNIVSGTFLQQIPWLPYQLHDLEQMNLFELMMQRPATENTLVESDPEIDVRAVTERWNISHMVTRMRKVLKFGMQQLDSMVKSRDTD